MVRKITFYALCAAGLIAVACLARWDDVKFPSETLRADVATDLDDGNSCVTFLTDYEEATERAIRERKPSLLFFMAKDCKFSSAMLNDAFTDPKVEKLARQFVCVEIDVADSRNEELCDEYNVDASPTVQFLTAEGTPLQRLTSVQTGEKLAEQMQAALTSVAWRSARKITRDTFLR